DRTRRRFPRYISPAGLKANVFGHAKDVGFGVGSSLHVSPRSTLRIARTFCAWESLNVTTTSEVCDAMATLAVGNTSVMSTMRFFVQVAAPSTERYTTIAPSPIVHGAVQAYRAVTRNKRSGFLRSIAMSSMNSLKELVGPPISLEAVKTVRSVRPPSS